MPNSVRTESKTLISCGICKNPVNKVTIDYGDPGKDNKSQLVCPNCGNILNSHK